MVEEHGTGDFQQHDARFGSVLTELTHIKDAQQLRYYNERIPRARHLFRISGALIIILSVSIPFLATLEGVWKNIALPIVALMIAGFTGLNAFFRWESNWKGYVQTKLTLEYMLWVWELRITEARHERDPQNGIEIALKATEQLLNNMQLTTSTESEEYFKRVQIPTVQQR